MSSSARSTMTTFVKRRDLEMICRCCGEKFMAADVKASVCPECRKPWPCQCGCGEMAKTRLRPFLRGHAGRIPSTKMIEGRKRQNLAIKGDNNGSRKYPERLSSAMKKYWLSLSRKEKRKRVRNHLFVKSPCGARYKRVDGFRSKLEVKVACLLTNLDVPYKYEKRHRFKNGRRFYPDFTIELEGEKVLIEISGFAYETWRRLFVKKVRKIKEAGHKVICVTYSKFIKEMRSRINVPCFTIKGLKRAYLHQEIGV